MPNKSLQAKRDGRFRRRSRLHCVTTRQVAMARQASSAVPPSFPSTLRSDAASHFGATVPPSFHFGATRASVKPRGATHLYGVHVASRRWLSFFR